MLEICNAFYNIIDQIKNTAQQLSPLESWVSVKIHREYIKVELPEWYLKDTHRRLEEILKNTFRPFNDYVDKLHKKFHIVFDPKSHDIYSRMGYSFQEKVSQVEDFNRLIRDINGMVNALSYDICFFFFLFLFLKIDEKKQAYFYILAGSRVLSDRDNKSNWSKGRASLLRGRSA